MIQTTQERIDERIAKARVATLMVKVDYYVWRHLWRPIRLRLREGLSGHITDEANR